MHKPHEEMSNPPKEFRAEYNAVKNLIHNDLKITKEDIVQIIKETVQTEIQKIYNSAYVELSIEKIVKQEIHGAFRSGYHQREAFKDRVVSIMKEQITTSIADQLTIDVKVNSK